MANNETTTSFKVDISELKKAMQEAKRQISVANSEFKAISSSMDNWAKSTDGLKAKLKQLDSNLTSQKTILSNLKEQYARVVEEQGEGSAAADRLKVAINNQQAVINNTEREIRNYSESLERAEEAEDIAARTGRDAAEVFDELGDEVEDAGNSAEKSSGGFTVMKGVLANLVTDGIRLAVDALKDFTKASIETGMGFESSMAEVSAISGATGKDFELLEETAKKYGATTTFSASEAAQALKYMALAGWDAEKSSSALGGVLDLAAASGMDLAQASDMVTDYMSAFGMEAEKSGYFADMLAFAQSNANTSAEELGEAYKNCAANLNAAGQDVETTTALLSMMANQGFKGSEAGTALTAIMRDMTAKMKDGQIMIGKTAVTVQDANGNYRDLTDILKDVEAATQGMGDAERATALSTTFTADSTKGLNLLLNAGVGEAEKFEDALRGAGGTAGDMAEVMNDNLAGDIKQAQSALEDLQITAYEELQPALREGVQYVTEKIIPMIKNDVIPVIKDEIIPAIKDFINKVLEIKDQVVPVIQNQVVPVIKEFIGWIVDHKDVVLAAISGIAAGFAAFKVIGAITGVISAIQSVISTVSALGGVVAALGGPVTIIIAVIAALVAGFIYLWNNCEGFRNFWINLWETIKTTVSTAVDGIVTFFTETLPNAFNSVIEWIKSNWQGLLLLLVNPFVGGFKLLYDNCEAFRTFIDNFVNGIKSFFTEKIPEIINNIVQWFDSLPEKIGYALGFALGTLIRWGVDLFNFVTTKVPEIIANIVKFFSELPSKIWTWLINTITKVIEWRNQMRDKAVEAGKSFIDKVVEFIKELPSKIWTWLVNTITKLTQWKNDMGQKGKEAIAELINKVLDGAKDIPSKMLSVGKNIVDGVWQGIQDAKDRFFDNVSEFFSGIVDGAKSALGINSPSKVFAKEVGKWIPEGIAVGVDANAKSALDAMKNLSTSMVLSARDNLSGAAATTGGVGGAISYTQIINSPKQLSRLDIYRQTKNLLGYAGGGV